MKENNLHSKIIVLVNREGRPLAIDYIANKLGIHWYTAYKAIADIIIAELQERHLDVLYELPLVPFKSTKSLVIVPRSMFLREETKGKQKEA
jgi:hypothetical protein